MDDIDHMLFEPVLICQRFIIQNEDFNFTLDEEFT